MGKQGDESPSRICSDGMFTKIAPPPGRFFHISKFQALNFLYNVLYKLAVKATSEISTITTQCTLAAISYIVRQHRMYDSVRLHVRRRRRASVEQCSFAAWRSAVAVTQRVSEILSDLVASSLTTAATHAFY